MQPDQATISRILKNTGRLNDIPIHQSTSLKNQRDVIALQLEKALYKWICVNSNKGFQIDGPVTIR